MPFRVLLPHIRRAMREAYVQKMAVYPTLELPDPVECGYKLNQDNELEIRWVADAAFPAFIRQEEEPEKEQNLNEPMADNECDECDDDKEVIESNEDESSDSDESDETTDSEESDME